MVSYGMRPAEVPQADPLNEAHPVHRSDWIGQLKPGFLAKIIAVPISAVPGNPLQDIRGLMQPVLDHFP